MSPYVPSPLDPLLPLSLVSPPSPLPFPPSLPPPLVQERVAAIEAFGELIEAPGGNEPMSPLVSQGHAEIEAPMSASLPLASLEAFGKGVPDKAFHVEVFRGIPLSSASKSGL